MDIKILELGPLATNAYVLLNRGFGEAFVVDAPMGAVEALEPILEEAECMLTGVLLTHGHWDHIAEAQVLKEKTGAQVYAHIGDRLWIEDPMMMAPFMPEGLIIKPIEVDTWLEGQSTCELLGEAVEIREVPGHAPGSVLFYFSDYACAFVGDAIFAGSVGRYDLPGGDGEQLMQAITRQVYTLPEDTVLYPGHGPATTVEQEKKTNPFVRGA
tara:strand:- start:12739 stop:13377 length:639 start_codon:yes stop_codon:yes gene_type:complete